MKWQPIETAPKDETVLVYGTWQPDWYNPPRIDPDVHKATCLEVSNSNGDWAWYVAGTDEDETYVYKPTHWMPLPLPPNVSRETQEWD